MTRWQSTLDWLIARKTEGRAQNATIRLLLQLGLYQFFWLQRIPDHAAVHETVELAKRLGFGARAGFLNAVLRGYIRATRTNHGGAGGIEANRSGPRLFPSGVAGPTVAGPLGPRANIAIAPMEQQPPAGFCAAEPLENRFPRFGGSDGSKEGVEFEQRSWDWTGAGLVFELRRTRRWPIARVFRTDCFTSRTRGTLLAVEQLAPQPGETILDLCAAPGGKTTFIAQRMGNRGRIVAHDTQPDRLKLLEENCHRLGVTCVQSRQCAGSLRRFDRILD